MSHVFYYDLSSADKCNLRFTDKNFIITFINACLTVSNPRLRVIIQIRLQELFLNSVN